MPSKGNSRWQLKIYGDVNFPKCSKLVSPLRFQLRQKSGRAIQVIYTWHDWIKVTKCNAQPARLGYPIKPITLNIFKLLAMKEQVYIQANLSRMYILKLKIVFGRVLKVLGVWGC